MVGPLYHYVGKTAKAGLSLSLDLTSMREEIRTRNRHLYCKLRWVPGLHVALEPKRAQAREGLRCKAPKTSLDPPEAWPAPGAVDSSWEPASSLASGSAWPRTL